MTTEERAVIKEHGLKTLVVDDHDLGLLLAVLRFARTRFRWTGSEAEIDEMLERIKDQTQ